MRPDSYVPGGLARFWASASGTSFSLVFVLTRLATAAVFLGRAWQHLRWDAPYRDLLWDEKWMGALTPYLGYPDWNAYVTDPANDLLVQQIIQGIGWFYLICAAAAVFIRQLRRPGRWLLRFGGISLIMLAALYTKEKFFNTGQFLEYTLQWSSPFFLAAFARRQEITERHMWLLKMAIAVTFICHGLYAVGYYPRPEVFQSMVMNILGLDNLWAIRFLNLAGALDFVFSIALFLPWNRVNQAAAAYLCFWGLMTTVARVWAFVHWEFLGSGLAQWLHESVYRLPHFLMPLAMFFLLRAQKRISQ